MVRALTYTRYSSSVQNEASCEQQERLLRDYAEKHGWQIVGSYSDQAYSGSNLMRPGIQALLAAVEAGGADTILTESIDRISRNIGDLGKTWERLRYLGVRIHTLNEGGDIGELQLGMKGTFSAVYLSDLARRTRRGMDQAALAGESAGGLSYGYDLERRYDDKRGRRIGGIRSVNEEQAAVIRRIFEEFANGKSPRAIAHDLNAEGIAGPRGGKWSPSTIYGNRRRLTGVLNNTLLWGVQTFGKQTFRRDPSTGRETGRMNDPSTWIVTNVPHLRIVSDELRDRAHARYRDLSDDTPFQQRRRPKHLLSFLLKCGECGSGFSLVSAAHCGCGGARGKGSAVCTNRLTIRKDELEQAVLHALRSRLLDPVLSRRLCKTYVEAINRRQSAEGTRPQDVKAELKRIENSLGKLVDAIANGVDLQIVREKISALQTRQAELEAISRTATSAPVFLMPNMAEHYHREVQALIEQLNDPAHRAMTAERLRALIDKIVLTPLDGKLEVTLHGKLAGILRLAAGFDPIENHGGLSLGAQAELEQIKLVVGGDDPVFQPHSKDSGKLAAPANRIPMIRS